MEGGEVAHHLFVDFLLVCMDCLGVLTKIVEPGEVFSTMTIERTLPGVLSGDNKRGLGRVVAAKGGRMVPDVPCKMLASAEDHPTVTIAPALEGFGRGGAITLVDPSPGDVGEVVDRQRVDLRRDRGGGRGRDDGGHGCLVLVGVQGGLKLHLPLCRTTRDSPLKGA
jgi:hypothetical protein